MRDLNPVSVSEFHAARRGGAAVVTTPHALAVATGAAPALKPRAFTRRAFSVTEINAALAAATGTPAGSGATAGVAVAGDLLIDTPGAHRFADLFGTFTHHCVEQLGAGLNTASALRDRALVPPRLRPDLEPGSQARFLNEGVSLAEAFLESDVWRESGKAESVEFELPFLLRLDSVRARGKIDFVVEFGDRVLVVDFKTDRVLVPEHYAGQLCLYRRAVESIYGKPSESLLYHLRTGEKVFISTEFEIDAMNRALLHTY